MILGGPFWNQATIDGNAVLVMMDILLLASAVYTLWLARENGKAHEDAVEVEEIHPALQTSEQ